MIIEVMKKDPRIRIPQPDRFVAFQSLPSQDGKKRGFICEAESMGEAMSGVVQLVAQHCTATGTHPSLIISKVEIK